MAEGRKVPAGYLDRPDVDVGSAFVWDAFWVLSSDRQLGFGEGPIPFSSIERYAARYGIDDLEDFDAFLSLIQDMDREYLKVRDQQQRDREDKPPPKQSDRPV